MKQSNNDLFTTNSICFYYYILTISMRNTAAPRRLYVLSNCVNYVCDLPYAYKSRQDANKLQLFELFRSIVVIIYYVIIYFT